MPGEPGSHEHDLEIIKHIPKIEYYEDERFGTMTKLSILEPFQLEAVNREAKRKIKAMME
jgi:primase-polymerase (primpol)-like protein